MSSSGGRGSVPVNADHSAELRSGTAGSKTNTSGLDAYLFASGLALSPDTPGPGGTDDVYGFVYVGAGRTLFIEAPAIGNLNGGGRIDLAPGGDNFTSGGNQNRVVISQPGAPGLGNRSGQLTFCDAAGALSASVGFGAGAPAIGGEAGDWYFNTDPAAAAGALIYRCTQAGAAGAAIWAPIL